MHALRVQRNGLVHARVYMHAYMYQVSMLATTHSPRPGVPALAVPDHLDLVHHRHVVRLLVDDPEQEPSSHKQTNVSRSPSINARSRDHTARVNSRLGNTHVGEVGHLDGGGGVLGEGHQALLLARQQGAVHACSATVDWLRYVNGWAVPCRIPPFFPHHLTPLLGPNVPSSLSLSYTSRARSRSGPK